MKVLVFAHQLELGGTQTNAIELTAALRDAHGFEVVLFATPGPMVEVARQLGLRYLPAPDPLIHPSPGRMLALASAVRRERPDLIHVWDWWQCIDVYFGQHLLRGIPLVVTDMNMTLTSMLPKTPLTTFGLPDLVSQARAAGWREAELLLPPVDVRLNAPGAVDASTFRKQCDIKDGELVIVTVSRLAPFLKGESLRRTIAAVRILGRELPVRLVLVGDGVARAELEQLAAEANAELARPVVMLAGPMQDPRPAYEAADILVGMGGSALRGMAFGKPVVIVGEQGFSNILNEETADWFYTNGIFGQGDGDPDNSVLVSRLRRLAESASERAALGGFARQFVMQNFSVETIGNQLAGYCRKAVSQKRRAGPAALDGARLFAVWARERRLLSYRFKQRLKRLFRPGRS